MKRKLLTFVMAMAMVLGLASCGGGGTTSTDGSQSTTGSTSSTGTSTAQNTDFKVGAIYINKKSDTAGYTYAHHTGITTAM